MAEAQASIDVRPSAAVTGLYDSNLFATASERRTDFVTRVTPSLDSDYRGARLQVSGRYTFDAERYATHDDLSTMHARQYGSFDVRYALTSRAALSATAGVSTTRMPGELLPQTGLILPRARASRVTGRSMLTRELGPRTEASAEYAFNEDRIKDGSGIRAHTATIGAEHHLSRRTSARIEYRGEHDSFGPQAAAAASSLFTHALTATWRRAIDSRVSLALTAGPRLTGGRVTPELFVTLQTRLERGGVSFAYQRTQTTVIGMARPVDIENVMGRVVWGATRGPSARIEPGFLRSRAGDQRTDVYRVGLGVEYPISRRLAFDIAVDTNVQNGRLHEAFAGGRISRHTASIRLVASSRSRRDR